MMIDAFWMQTKMKLEWVFHEFAFFWQNFLSKHPISITNGCEDSCLINLCSRRVSYIHTCMWQYSLDTQWYSRRILSFLWDRLTRNTCWEHYLGCPKFWGNRFHNLHVFFFFLMFGFSLDMNQLSMLGQHEWFTRLLNCYKLLPVFLFNQWSTIQTNQWLLSHKQ